MMDQDIENPTCILVGSELKQIRNLYLPHFQKIFQPLKPSYSTENSVFSVKRDLENRDRPDVARVLFGEGNERSKGFRGATGHILGGDEYGDWKDGFLHSVLLPMGDVNSAYCLITGTPRGPNHFKRDFNNAYKRMMSGDKDYYALKWTIEDSLRAGEIPQKTYDLMRKRYEGEKEWEWQAEYMLDFDASIPGRMFVPYIVEAQKKKNIGHYPYCPDYPTCVDTFWDIGVRSTAVWFRQKIGGYHFYFKYFQDLIGADFHDLVKTQIIPFIMRNGIRIRYNVFPHDMVQKEWMSPKTRIEVARQILPGQSIVRPAFKRMDEAVDAVCRNFHRCKFDDHGCEIGLNCLKMISMKGGKFDKLGEFAEYSHGADAFVLAETFDRDSLGSIGSTLVLDKQPKSNSLTLEESFRNWGRDLRSGKMLGREKGGSNEGNFGCL